jgi:hypothetical protein
VPRYNVEMRIDFSGVVEADSQDEAEQLAWTSWGDTLDNDITYDGVHDISVDEIEEEDEDKEDE